MGDLLVVLVDVLIRNSVVVGDFITPLSRI